MRGGERARAANRLDKLAEHGEVAEVFALGPNSVVASQAHLEAAARLERQPDVVLRLVGGGYWNEYLCAFFPEEEPLLGPVYVQPKQFDPRSPSPQKESGGVSYILPAHHFVHDPLITTAAPRATTNGRPRLDSSAPERILLGMATTVHDDFVEGVITGFAFQRGPAYEVLGEALGKRWGVPPLGVRETAVAGLLAMYTPSPNRTHLTLGTEALDAEMRGELARHLPSEIAHRVAEDTDVVVRLRQEIIAERGGPEPNMTDFSPTMAKLLARQHPEYNFEAVATLLTQETGLSWCVADAVAGMCLLGLDKALPMVINNAEIAGQDEAVLALVDEFRNAQRAALGPARTAALEKIDPELVFKVCEVCLP